MDRDASEPALVERRSSARSACLPMADARPGATARVTACATACAVVATVSAARRRLGAVVAVVLALAAAACGDGANLLFLGGRDSVPERIVLTAVPATTTSVRLDWTSAGAGLAYQVERDGEPVATTNDLSRVDAGLAVDQRHCYRVWAYGGFGWNARSNEACVGTDSGLTGWRFAEVGAGRAPSVSVGASGNVHVCHAGASGGIVHRVVDPLRAAELVDADGQGRCAIAVSAAGTVHVVYLSRFGLRHASRSAAGTWSATTVDAEALVSQPAGDGPSLALAPDGAPRIAYRRPALNGLASVAVATRVGSGWSFDLSGLAGRIAHRSIAVDNGGRTWLALVDELGQAVSVWSREPGGWLRAVQQGLAPNRGDGPPVAIDTDGQPSTAFWRRPSTGGGVSLRHLGRDASGWRTADLVAVSDAGWRIALAAGNGGALWAAWAGADGRLGVASRNGVTWTVDAIDGQPGGAEIVDLVVASDGQVRVVYDRPQAGTVGLASRRP